MGAESSSLEECSLETPIIQGSENQWEVRHGITFENDSRITVFTEKTKKKEKLRIFERNIKFLRSIRHPNILHYIRDGKNEDRYLVTERAVPLSLLLKNLSPLEVASGICNIISALTFLHDKATICHNNITLDVIYVTDNGHWKLGGFECACRFTELSPDFLKSIEKYRDEASIAPEENEAELNLTAEFAHSRDVYSFGVLVDSLLEQLEDLDDIIKTFELRVQDECLNNDPKMRPKLHTFLEDKIFSNDLLSLSTFLHHITLKNKDEREEFYRSLLPRLQSLPEETVGKHLVKPLLCRFVMLDKTARELVTPHILTPNRDYKSEAHRVSKEITPLFSVAVYQQYVIPELYKAFCCHEINIRTVLLKYFSYYADLFDKEKLEDVIFPQILLGIRDTSEELATLSLHSLADLIPILGRDTVIGGRSKTYFIEGTPKNSMGSHQEKDTAKNVNGVIGKVKLKDLATISGKPKTENNQIADRISREERMKEAREKREQRRLERENKKNKVSSAEKSQTAKISVPELSHTDNLLSSQSDYFIEEKKGSHLIDSVQHEVFTEDQDDWSDWENENLSLNDDWSNLSHDNASSPTNSSVSIETAQLHSQKQMDSQTTLSAIETRKDSWSSGYKESEIQSMDTKNKTGQNVSPKKSAMSLKGKAKPIKPKSNDALGAEFDIHSIEIKVKAETQREVDFFADMMPDIKPTTSKETSLNLNVQKSPASDSKTDKSAMFSYSATEDTSGAGWGDDGWDVEGF